MISSNAMLITWIVLCVLILGVAIAALTVALMQKRRLDKLVPPKSGGGSHHDVKDIKNFFHDHEKVIIISSSVIGGLIVIGLIGYFGYRYYKKRSKS